jgi:hypothetical protein
MITEVVQRWREGRAKYRPAGELARIDPRRYEVAALDGDGADTVARAFVERHHYSSSYPAARERVGLYRAGELVGMAVFSHPPTNSVLDVLPCAREAAVELGRLVLLEDVEANGETWFIARAFAELRRRGYAGVISFADPVLRTTAAGVVVFPGHVGRIYQASNAVFTGRASPRTKRLLPDGRIFDERAWSKIRARHTGWRYAVDQLVAAGAQAPMRTASAADLRAWLKAELPRCTRPFRHRGNYRYLFGLHPAVRHQLQPLAQPYPKFTMPR